MMSGRNFETKDILVELGLKIIATFCNDLSTCTAPKVTKSYCLRCYLSKNILFVFCSDTPKYAIFIFIRLGMSFCQINKLLTSLMK